MTIEVLKFYYPGKQLVADGGALTQYVADGGTTSTIVDAALTEADDFFNGGIIFFSGTTPTVALRGQTAHIRDFDAATDTLTLAKALPAAVAAGDEYKIIIGGNYRSDTEVLGLLAGGVFPELEPIALTNITGVTLKYASPGILQNDTSITIAWDNTFTELSLNFGPPHIVVGDANDVVLEDPFEGGFVIVDIVQASLPASFQTDVLTATKRNQTIIPDIEGYESRNALKGKTRYQLMVLRNEDVAALNNFELAAVETFISTTVDTGETVPVTANSFDVAFGNSFPTSGFWIKNTDLDDMRYVESRSGDTFTVAAADTWTKITADANNTVEPLPGDTITSNSGGQAIIDNVLLNSGSWAGGDANATFYLKDVTGTFIDTDQLQISAVNIAVQSGAEARGLRDKTAQTWTAGDNIVLISPVDIAVQAPTGGNQFANPADETTYPDPTLNFLDNTGVFSEPIALGNLAVNDIYGVWFREWIMDNGKANNDLNADLEYSWS